MNHSLDEQEIDETQTATRTDGQIIKQQKTKRRKNRRNWRREPREIQWDPSEIFGRKFRTNYHSEGRKKGKLKKNKPAHRNARANQRHWRTNISLKERILTNEQQKENR